MSETKSQDFKNARKIAFYIGSLSKGGAERVFVNLGEYFYTQGYRVLFVTQYQRDNEYEVPKGCERVISDILPEETSDSRLINFFRRLKKLRKIWVSEKPDLVLSCVCKNNLMTIITTRFNKTRAVVSVVGEAALEYPGKIWPFLANCLFPMAEGIILQTERSRRFFSKKVSNKAVVLPNSLNPDFMRERFEGERDKEIVSIGRMDENKNQKMIINAFAELSSKYPEYRLTIYGDGELRPELENRINNLGLNERIILPGVVTDIAARIEKCSVFVLVSDSEGVSNALIEALSLGLPTIATDVPSGGTEELMEDGKSGRIIPVGDEKALTAALDEMLSDSEKAAEYGRNAIKIQDRLRPDRVNRIWQDYFEGLF